MNRTNAPRRRHKLVDAHQNVNLIALGALMYTNPELFPKTTENGLPVISLDDKGNIELCAKDEDSWGAVKGAHRKAYNFLGGGQTVIKRERGAQAAEHRVSMVMEGFTTSDAPETTYAPDHNRETAGWYYRS